MASSAPDRVTRSVSATADPPKVGIANPIHADDGASGAGYAAALVAGVRTYGWVTEAVLEALGAITVERTGPGTRGSGADGPGRCAPP